MTKPESKRASPYPLRIESSLKQWAEERAKQNGRSMNAEIIQILREVKEGVAEQAAYERGRLAGIQQAMNP
ncbi:Arc family DNA-binding protein [Thiothrix lacustris]|uniref:Arc family DNA-binding protein n=1 Tax=Thiothrix lacustris TaxID=525917 RepID=A0ABY9MQN0_9GAMM|nr:Arc family DNA-binding protein [Thiothrix lacustris]WML90858.1 Arc family DNA-binding protein [Thiothrix lacustris]